MMMTTQKKKNLVKKVTPSKTKLPVKKLDKVKKTNSLELPPPLPVEAKSIKELPETPKFLDVKRENIITSKSSNVRPNLSMANSNCSKDTKYKNIDLFKKYLDVLLGVFYCYIIGILVVSVVVGFIKFIFNFPFNEFTSLPKTALIFLGCYLVGYISKDFFKK